MRISREIKTAILAISAIALFLLGYNYLKGEDIFSNYNTYYTEFEYNAVETSTAVTIKGFRVGRVEQVQFDTDTDKVKVKFKVSSDYKFPKTSLVRLYEVGPMAGNALAIIQVGDGPIAESGDFLQSEIKKGMVRDLQDKFTVTQTELTSTLKTADTLLNNLNTLATDSSEKGLKSAIAELNQTLRSFNKLSKTLDGFIKEDNSKLNQTLTNLNETISGFKKVSDDLSKTQLNETVAKLDKTLDNLSGVLNGINQGKGTMGKLMQDEALYNNLENATKELESLLKDIKLHPKRYFRILSKKEIPYKEETK